MCLIIASPTGKAIPPDVLTDAFNSNRDGAGIAWLENRQVKFKKGLDLQAFLALGASMTLPHIAHCRIASVGPSLPVLTHPFPISPTGSSAGLEGTAKSVLFQNGTWSAWEDHLLTALMAAKAEIPPPPWSDSRALAILVHYYGPNILHLLNNSSRFAILDGDGVPGKTAMVLMGEWELKDGFWFSHHGSCAFRPPTPTYVPAPNASSQVNDYYKRRNSSTAKGPNSSAPETFQIWEAFDESGLERHQQS